MSNVENAENTGEKKVVEITRPQRVKTMKEKDPAKYAVLKRARKSRRLSLRNALKALGYKPNADMTRCKKTGVVLADGGPDKPSSITMEKLKELAPKKQASK